jgi:hypothetical protein
MMADVEKEENTNSPSGTAESDVYLPMSFQPIGSVVKGNSRSNYHLGNTATSLRSISRTRSNNGYGCDDVEEDTKEGAGDIEGGAAVQKDPFEVHWDGGDNDPMNPRSLSMAKKWVIVLIVSASSLCVYVLLFLVVEVRAEQSTSSSLGALDFETWELRHLVQVLT